MFSALVHILKRLNNEIDHYIVKYNVRMTESKMQDSSKKKDEDIKEGKNDNDGDDNTISDNKNAGNVENDNQKSDSKDDNDRDKKNKAEAKDKSDDKEKNKSKSAETLARDLQSKFKILQRSDRIFIFLVDGLNKVDSISKIGKVGLTVVNNWC